MKKTLALCLALTMVLALAACGSTKGEDPVADAAEVITEAAIDGAVAAAETTDPPVDEAADEDADFAAYKEYFGAYAAAGAPNEEEAANMAGLIEACGSFEDIEAIPQSTVLFDSVGVLRYQAWLDAGKPEADAEGIGSEADKQAASGEPSQEPAADAPAEAAAEAGDASGEPSAEPSGEPSGNASADYEITVNGISGIAHYEDTDNGDQATKSFVITFNGKEIQGAIDKGVWTAASGDAADQAVVEAVQAAFEGK